MVTIEDLRSRGTVTITRAEAADALGVDPRTVTEGIRQGNIPAVKIGRRVLIPRAKFIALFVDDPISRD